MLWSFEEEVRHLNKGCFLLSFFFFNLMFLRRMAWVVASLSIQKGKLAICNSIEYYSLNKSIVKKPVVIEGKYTLSVEGQNSMTIYWDENIWSMWWMMLDSCRIRVKIQSNQRSKSCDDHPLLNWKYYSQFLCYNSCISVLFKQFPLLLTLHIHIFRKHLVYEGPLCIRQEDLGTAYFLSKNLVFSKAWNTQPPTPHPHLT